MGGTETSTIMFMGRRQRQTSGLIGVGEYGSQSYTEAVRKYLGGLPAMCHASSIRVAVFVLDTIKSRLVHGDCSRSWHL